MPACVSERGVGGKGKEEGEREVDGERERETK